MKAESLKKIENECLSCAACPLCSARTNVVFGAGNPDSKILFVGEGPGENEDLQGEPFVGKAGQLLDLILELTGFSRQNVYICNTVKCRPPQNRDPSPAERSACRKWLDAQLETINPEIIVCLGRIAAQELISPDFKITKEHGEWFDFAGKRIMATYHPSALLRDESKRPDCFADFQKIREECRKLKINT